MALVNARSPSRSSEGAGLGKLIWASEGQAASSAPVSTRLTNNLVLKKLRIAFELKEEDLLEIFALAQFRISKPEVTALFRAPGHQNYRVCGDQILRNFLKGLAARMRRPKDSKSK